MSGVAALTLASFSPVCDRAIFLRRRGGKRGRVIDLTAVLLMVGATFFVADGIQTVAAGALRGMNDTRIPLLFPAISYWLIGFPAAYGLASARAWRHRRLDRAILRHRGLCRSSDLRFRRLAINWGHNDERRAGKAMKVREVEPK